MQNMSQKEHTAIQCLTEIIRFQFEPLKESPQAECNKLMKTSDRLRPSSLACLGSFNPIAQFNHYLQMFNEPQGFEVFYLIKFFG